MRRLSILRSINVTLLAVAFATEANAALPATRTVKATPGQMLDLAEQMSRAGQIAQAEQILELLAHDPNSDVRHEARFRQAMLLEARGEDRAAAVLYRRILDDKPSAAPVRLKLATMLQKMGDEAAARRELRALRTTDLPPNVARFVDRWSASLQATKPFGVQVELALAPDSNINRATRSDTLSTVIGDFTFEEDSQRKSGVGIAARGWTHYRLSLGKDVNLAARASADLNLYRHREFNDISAEVSVGPEFRLLDTRFTLEAGLGQRWYGMKPYQRHLRLSGSATRSLGATSQLRVDGSLRWVNNAVNDLQDGRGITAGLRFEKALSQSTSITVNLVADRFKAEDDAYSTRSWAAGLTAYRDLGRMTFSLGAEIGRLKADDRLSLLPEAREDRLTRFSLGAVFRQLTVAGFAPMTRIIVERNRSSVEFYDFKRTRTEFGVSRAF